MGAGRGDDSAARGVCHRFKRECICEGQKEGLCASCFDYRLYYTVHSPSRVQRELLLCMVGFMNVGFVLGSYAKHMSNVVLQEVVVVGRHEGKVFAHLRTMGSITPQWSIYASFQKKRCRSAAVRVMIIT